MFNANRRRILFGLAAAATTAATGATEGSASAPAECPELIALADALPGLHAEFVTAKAEFSRIVAEAKAIWPLAPDEIIWFLYGSKVETDITGAAITRKARRAPVAQVWRYGTPEMFAADAAKMRECIAHIMTTKSKRGLKQAKSRLAEAERALPLSRAYCAEIERVTEASGYRAAEARKDHAKEALRSHVGKIMEAKPQTMEGVVIQAQALAAWSDADPAPLVFNGTTWGKTLAATIIRHGATA